MFDKSFLMLSHEIAQAARPTTDRTCRVSVIIPCYNSANFIRPCLESLAQQTLPLDAFEIICIDDCSTDDTVAVLAEWERRLSNLRVIRHTENRKQGAARNTGLDAARGEFIIFVDSDDFLRPDALETLLAASEDGSDVVVGQLLRVRYDQNYSPKPAFRRMPDGKDVSALTSVLGWFPVCMLMRSEMLKQHGIRFREGVYFEDIDFCIRLFLACDTCRIINDKLYYYVQRDGSTVNSMDEKKLADSASAMAGIFKFIGERPDLLKVFVKTATSWLRLQASRIRDGGKALEDRHQLGEFLVAEVQKAGVHRHIGEVATKELARIAAGEPKLPTISPLDAGHRTSSSPWGGALEWEFEGKVIFFCEVDYHIRSAASIVRQLKKMNIPSIIVDASRSTSFSTNRPLPDHELPLYADLDIRQFNVAVEKPFSTEGAAFVFMNDLTYTKELILENFGFGVPTIGFYEGINDDWNLDRKAPRRPYRSVDYLLLPGIYQQGFYADRETRVVGLPNVRSRLAQPYVAPTKRRAIINVNFTYGVLEDRRDAYVESAVAACNELGLDYVITQHPADKGDLSRYNVGKDSVYSLLEEGTILISRFSTTILEALAMGRPAIYHNPIDERVPKFKVPLGAYPVTDGKDSLKHALERELAFLDDGGDIRKRAALFLHFHCNTGDSSDPDLLAAHAIAEIVKSPEERYAFKRPASLPMIPVSQAPEADVAGDPAFDLPALAAQLLLDPDTGRARLQEEADAVTRALAALPEDSPVRQHFQRVREFAEAG